MGNTNLPQFGAADIENSRDTLSGTSQLTDEQKRKKKRHPASGQEAESGEGNELQDPKAEQAASREPKSAIRRGHAETIVGHVDTGHSPPDAT